LEGSRCLSIVLPLHRRARRDNRRVPESAIDVVLRLGELFNRALDQGEDDLDDLRALFHDEPVIVPIRAALEGTEYTGSQAVDEFIAASRESWSRIRIEPTQARSLDPERVLVVGDLIGTGRETGAETQAHVAWLFVVRDGKIAEARTFTSEDGALMAAER
ncbi:MAG: nuclear transport factor 2 family protein, partial [Solirubrobacterales bacterium]